MKNEIFDDTFLARWLNGQLSEEELAAFEAHEDYPTYQKIASTSADLGMPPRDKEAGWQALSQEMEKGKQQEPTQKVVRLNNWWKYAAAAAAVLLVAYFGFFQRDALQTHTTLLAEQKVVTLPDGSTAHLNADSEIRFNQETFLDERVLDLEGEAFFEVAKGTAFTVATPRGDVRVLGTSFNVRSRDRNIEVICYTGKVGLSFDKFQQMEILNPGDRILGASQGEIQKSKITQGATFPGWTKGESRFIQTDILEVVEELQRQFDIQIEYPANLAEVLPYSGGFPHNDLDSALKIIFSSIGYQYKIKGKEVVVFK